MVAKGNINLTVENETARPICGIIVQLTSFQTTIKARTWITNYLKWKISFSKFTPAAGDCWEEANENAPILFFFMWILVLKELNTGQQFIS